MREYKIRFYNDVPSETVKLFGSDAGKKIDKYVEQFDNVLSMVKASIEMQMDLMKNQVKNYPIATLDMPEALQAETNFIKGSMVSLDVLIDCLYKLQPLV